MLKEGICKYYNGFFNGYCGQGIQYDSFPGTTQFTLSTRAPCFRRNGINSIDIFCSACEYPSPEEIKKEEELIEKIKEAQNRRKIKRPTYRELAEALMDMINQHCSDGDIVHHDFISANRGAFSLLENLGLLEDLGNEKYKLNWKGLNDETP